MAAIPRPVLLLKAEPLRFRITYLELEGVKVKNVLEFSGYTNAGIVYWAALSRLSIWALKTS